MAKLENLKAFSIDEANLTLWVFRKESVKDNAPIFRARWAELGNGLASAVKIAAKCDIENIEEINDYSLLAENNETSALNIGTMETHADALIVRASAETPDLRVLKQKHLENILFYVVKFSVGDKLLFGIRKTDNSWKVQKRKDYIQFLFENNTLILDASPSFNISSNFDFFILDDETYVKSKRNFESVVEYKRAHQQDFKLLCDEGSFKAAFIDLDELVKFVGNNKIMLRRMVAIREKKHYENANLMANLRKDFAKAKLHINFSPDGKIVPTPETCKDIFQALLDHRLYSAFSANVYDVPNTSAPS